MHFLKHTQVLKNYIFALARAFSSMNRLKSCFKAASLTFICTKHQLIETYHQHNLGLYARFIRNVKVNRTPPKIFLKMFLQNAKSEKYVILLT